ncbi:MAG TPA: DUF6282 family protein, partial [Candidatus Sulfotelmatobacter sp.]|nr:DUF6282 family protein [Candidatus Sulfotelmatobacter sp.]
EVLKLIAEADIILATGHQSVREIKIVVDAALAAGVRKILINHPELWLIGMSIEDQCALAAKGAMLEMCIRSVTARAKEGLTPTLLADQIKGVGAQSVVMATDFGQTDSPPAPEGLCRYIGHMLDCGIPAADIEAMTKANPARLLGL